ALRRRLHARVALARRVARETGEDLDLAPAGIERRDERLLDRDGAVEGAMIAPRLELVRAGDVRGADLARLVHVRREVDGQADRAELLAELEIGGSVVDRVAAE